MNPTPEQCQALIEALAPFESPYVLTPDEEVCLNILREAAQKIAAGEDLVPPVEGQTHKLRLWRRVSVAFIHPEAPRARQVTAPDGRSPAAQGLTLEPRK